MREIEIKARVKDLKKLEETITDKGIKIGKELKQHDVVYGEVGDLPNGYGHRWLRIRTENSTKVYFTYKQSIVGHLDSLEHEIVVDSAEELEAIIKALGFKPYSDLTKVRRKFKVGEVEVCVDSLPRLGDYIEAEKMSSQDDDHDEVVKELWELLNSYGINKTDEEHDGYDVLDRRAKGLVN
ncbi:MAG: class IV adenylate cyclase [Candidatus Saccharimonadales bacterium]